MKASIVVIWIIGVWIVEIVSNLVLWAKLRPRLKMKLWSKIVKLLPLKVLLTLSVVVPKTRPILKADSVVPMRIIVRWWWSG